MKTLAIIFLLFPACIEAQVVHVKITLYANEGGFHTNMKVTMVDSIHHTRFSGITDVNGQVTIDVTPACMYDVKIPNYTERKIINVPNAPGATMTTNIYYSRNMLKEEEDFRMSDAEKRSVDTYAATLPDTTFIRSPYAEQMKENYNCYHISLQIMDLDDTPLPNEVVRITGRKRHKCFKGTTGADGVIWLNLPKGDNYDLSFLYHHDYEYTECRYSKGISEIEWQISYIGTRKYKTILEAEAKRLKEEEERLKAEEARFKKFCEDHHCTPEEGRRLEMTMNSRGADQTVIADVMKRNKFKDPLFVTDVTGSMSPYMSSLAEWYKGAVAVYPKAQFIFFNDGDNKADHEKVAGSTGGIYYQGATSYDSLIKKMSFAAGRGNGGDAPENNMEALIKGSKLAKNYGDIIMVADNNAPVSDISLLSEFDKPVHIILCGGNGTIERDYLVIAWRTHGSVHTMTNDYDLSALQDGQTIRIGEENFKLMHGDFVPLN